MSPFVHAFRVSHPQGGYRSFADFATWNAYLLAIEAQGHKWTLSHDCATAYVVLSK